MSKGIKLDARGKIKLSEADVTEQVIDLFESHGWTCIRQQVGLFYPRKEVITRLLARDHDITDWRPVTIGAEGDPDWICLKPTGRGSLCKVVFIEMKTKRGRFQQGQPLRHVELRQKGFDVRVIRSFQDALNYLTYKANTTA